MSNMFVVNLKLDIQKVYFFSDPQTIGSRKVSTLCRIAALLLSRFLSDIQESIQDRFKEAFMNAF